MTSRSVSTRWSVARRHRHSEDLLNCKRYADGDNGLTPAQLGNCEIVVAAAVAETMAGAVKDEERRQNNVWIDRGCLCQRLANAPDAGGERLAPCPFAHDERLAAAGDDRKRQPCALSRELAQ